jgi:hypothetical protein
MIANAQPCDVEKAIEWRQWSVMRHSNGRTADRDDIPVVIVAIGTPIALCLRRLWVGGLP